MPLEKIVMEDNRAWAIWKVDETESELTKALPKEELCPEGTTHPQKRLEFMAGRVLVSALMSALGLEYKGIVKDIFGKPFLIGYPHQLSVSHSYPYIAAIIDKDQNVGIDLEQPKVKLLRIAPRVLSSTELEDAGNDIVKHCIFWCAKEALIKIHGKKDLTLAENIKISPFERMEEGNIIGRLIVDGIVSIVPLQYRVNPHFVLVFNAGKT
jgi:phosphopantetheinyl transferase